MFGKYIAGAGVGYGLVTNPETNKEEPSISLVIPKENPVDDDPENPENYEDFFMSVAAAKALQVDLREILRDFDKGKLSR
jgi:hypothetical protein